jgi:hypothetical protein
VFLLKNG